MEMRNMEFKQELQRPTSPTEYKKEQRTEDKIKKQINQSKKMLNLNNSWHKTSKKSGAL